MDNIVNGELMLGLQSIQNGLDELISRDIGGNDDLDGFKKMRAVIF